MSSQYITNGQIPAYYGYINVQNASMSPSTVHVKNTYLSSFFAKYLLQKAISVFEWTIPEFWSRDYFLYVLYCWGFASVINTDKYGVIPQACTLQGYDVFYRPNKAVVTNPLLQGIRELWIDRQCTLLKLQPDYSGIMDVVNYYADMLALASEAAAVNLVNTKLSYVFGATNKQAAETYKKLYDRVAGGEPAVVIDTSLLGPDGKPTWATFTQNVGQNYIVDRLLADTRQIDNMFDTDIGIPNINSQKKERLITDEVEANRVETQSKCALWLEQLKADCKKTNAMFGTKISVDWRFDDATISPDTVQPRQ